jgi:hypothetical protein
VVIHSELLTDDTPEPQVVEVAITGRANGDYRYVAELVNATGTTTSPERKVKVKDAG